MIRITLTAVLLFVTILIGYRPLTAQDFRITTRVYDEQQESETGHNRVVSRSLTLFHAGKVYDYLDAIGEVIVMEKTHNRITILNTTRHLATVVNFDEIKRMSKLRQQETAHYIRDLYSEDAAKAQIVEGMLKLQMTPEFEVETADEETRIVLVNDLMSYDVKLASSQHADQLEAYLAYADWMARLNSVLHPQALLPEPRLELNRVLRQRGRIPVEVTLRADLEARVDLRAQHSYGWQLDRLDRKLIHKWESALKSSNLERVTLHEYQARLLLTEYRAD